MRLYHYAYSAEIQSCWGFLHTRLTLIVVGNFAFSVSTVIATSNIIFSEIYAIDFIEDAISFVLAYSV